ncbi:DUF1707 and DUF2154 domain-containing protein [Vallicoccus soli]|uniref:DUF1707 and DUF2154 domain-containing protein n=1 Tax=Vallicoccus soli TaxID=2339232 RepID=A0A3A3Z5S7_9ACTN|nr:DUF1707 and DUF2154 domain-containing protein [Vallicoccus soli]
MRCGHQDRDAVAEVLRRAAGDGFLDLEELDERLERAHSARTYGELDALLADLPGAAAPGPAALPVPVAGGLPVGEEDVLRLSAPVGDRKQEGRWVVPRRIVAEAGLGTVKVDFTEAVCAHPVVEVQVRASVGNVVLVVPEGWSARTDQVSAGVGSVKNKVGESPGGGGTLLHVRGSAGVGDVVVRFPRTSRWLPR